MDYSSYTTENFLMDENFQQWVLFPTGSSDKFWHDFLQKHPYQRANITAARKKILSIGFQNYQPDPKSFSRVKQNISQKIKTQEKQEESPVKKRFFYLKIAASVMGFCLLMVGLWFYHARTISYKTAYAETRELLLPDGSSIVLNANSALLLSEWKFKNKREVWLEGEGYFEIQEDTTKPFVVHSGGLEILVTGTSFNVNSRRQTTQVVLASGKVLVKGRQQDISLLPGDMVEYDDLSATIIQRKVQPEHFTSWRNQFYYFEESSLSSIGAFIESQFGYDVEIEEELKALKFTAAISVGKLDDLLVLLKETMDIQIEQGGGRIVISGN